MNQTQKVIDQLFLLTNKFIYHPIIRDLVAKQNILIIIKSNYHIPFFYLSLKK